MVRGSRPLANLFFSRSSSVTGNFLESRPVPVQADGAWMLTTKYTYESKPNMIGDGGAMWSVGAGRCMFTCSVAASYTCIPIGTFNGFLANHPLSKLHIIG